MTQLFASTKVRIWGSKNAWSLSKDYGYSSSIKCQVELEINGDDKNGYHFIMKPEGFFTADDWHETLQDALDAGRELFGIDLSEWRKSDN